MQDQHQPETKHEPGSGQSIGDRTQSSSAVDAMPAMASRHSQPRRPRIIAMVGILGLLLAAIIFISGITSRPALGKLIAKVEADAAKVPEPDPGVPEPTGDAIRLRAGVCGTSGLLASDRQVAMDHIQKLCGATFEGTLSLERQLRLDEILCEIGAELLMTSSVHAGLGSLSAEIVGKSEYDKILSVSAAGGSVKITRFSAQYQPKAGRPTLEIRNGVVKSPNEPQRWSYRFLERAIDSIDKLDRVSLLPAQKAALVAEARTLVPEESSHAYDDEMTFRRFASYTLGSFYRLGNSPTVRFVEVGRQYVRPNTVVLWIFEGGGVTRPANEAEENARDPITWRLKNPNKAPVNVLKSSTNSLKTLATLIWLEFGLASLLVIASVLLLMDGPLARLLTWTWVVGRIAMTVFGIGVFDQLAHEIETVAKENKMVFRAETGPDRIRSRSVTGGIVSGILPVIAVSMLVSKSVNVHFSDVNRRRKFGRQNAAK